MLWWKQQTLGVEGPTCCRKKNGVKFAVNREMWCLEDTKRWGMKTRILQGKSGGLASMTQSLCDFFFCLQHFCFYSYRQYFQHPHPTPPSFPSPPKHQFPFSISSCCLTQPKPLVLFFLASLSYFCFFFPFFIIIIIIVKCIWRKPLCIIL